MILNKYTLFDLFLLSLQGLLGLALLFVAWRMWRAYSRDNHDPGNAGAGWERTSSLALIISAVLLILHVCTWPFLYLLLQSYVPEWPRVMCIFGVTQIGARSDGIASWLPTLITIVQWLKPILILLGGVWFLCRHLEGIRDDGRGRLPLLAATLFLGAVSLTGSVLEASYLLIPKSDASLSIGCCTTAVQIAGQNIGDTATSQSLGRWFFPLQLIVLLLLLAQFFRPELSNWARLSGALALGLVPLGLAFLGGRIVPSVLDLPDHRCVYDLMALKPESLVGLGLFGFGTMSSVWAAIGTVIASKKWSQPTINTLTRWALYGYSGALMFFISQNWIAHQHS